MDEKSSLPTLDTQHIRLDDHLGLSNWARALGATRDELKAAIAEVGPSIDRVIEHLRGA